MTVWRNGAAYTPPHLSKDQDIRVAAGDRIEVGTPGGGVVRFTLQTDGPFELVGAPARTAPGVYLGRYPD